MLAWLFSDLPDLNELPQHLNQPSVRIVDRNGRTLYEVLPEQGGRHAVVSLSQIPLACQQATIATEDRGFYQNPGVDLVGILRAAWINARHMQPIRVSKGETVIGSRAGFATLYRVRVGQGELIYFGWDVAASLPHGRSVSSVEQEIAYEQQMQILSNVMESITATPQP